MNIYQKLSAVRVAVQDSGMKKSGKNNHAKYEYFELEDMLPEINRLEQKHGLCSYISFGQDMAILNIVDAEKPEGEAITVTSPMSTAKLPACHDVQNLGAVQSYLRRYLYMAAYNIVECDALDASQGAAPPNGAGRVNTQAQNEPAQKPPQGATQANFDCPNQQMLDSLYVLAQSRGYNQTAVDKAIAAKFKCAPAVMTLDMYQAMRDGYAGLPEKAAS